MNWYLSGSTGRIEHFPVNNAFMADEIAVRRVRTLMRSDCTSSKPHQKLPKGRVTSSYPTCHPSSYANKTNPLAAQHCLRGL